MGDDQGRDGSYGDETARAAGLANTENDERNAVAAICPQDTAKQIRHVMDRLSLWFGLVLDG